MSAADLGLGVARDLAHAPADAHDRQHRRRKEDDGDEGQQPVRNEGCVGLVHRPKVSLNRNRSRPAPKRVDHLRHRLVEADAELASALRELEIQDSHVFDIEAALLQSMQSAEA